MSVAKTVHDYLQARGLPESVLQHSHTSCSSETAEAAHVSGRQLAKGVVLRTQDGFHLLAVIPAHRQLAMDKISETYGGHLELAGERELGQLFPDCELGAVPALGMAYRLPTYVDEALFKHDEIYFEGGDHESLIGMSGEEFADLFDEPSVGDFSRQAGH